MKNETAIEWLLIEIKKLTGISIHMDERIIERALEMEKEQIRDAFNSGMDNSEDYFHPFLEPNDESENYYNETYKNGK